MKTIFPGIGIPIIKIRQWWDCLIFIMVIPIRVRWHLYTETAPLIKRVMYKIRNNAFCTNLWNLLHPAWPYRSENREKGGRFNKKIPSYQYRKFHCGDKTILWSSYLPNGISYTGKMTSLYWIKAQGVSACMLGRQTHGRQLVKYFL